MASGPYFDPRRGTWSVQWFDGTAWRRVVVVRKRPGWRPGKVSKTPPPEALAALAEYADRERRTRHRGVSPCGVTVADFLARYRESYHGRRPGSAVELKNACARFAAWCDRQKIRSLEEVTVAACNQWLDARASETSPKTGGPTARATIVKERGLLGAAWAEAVRREELERNPWVSALVPGKPTKAARGSWSPEDLTRLLQSARPWLRDILILGCHTGLRISALLALEWSDIHWAPEGPGFGHVAVRPELDKTGKGYRVPIDRTCHDLLARRYVHREADATRVITGQQGAPINWPSVSQRAIRAACARAGLPKPDSPNHHMRRTFGRQAVLGQLTGRPIPLYVVSRWMGHSSVAMTEHYLDLAPDDSARWMAEIDDSPAPAQANCPASPAPPNHQDASESPG